ncbi:hypothetical protein GCM10009654_59120 [Streptomyces hebeiensis]|uniref:Uncharacterized protein n=1 Tax=Streptomyces hebeiensis TaxID=229486 RepID=A0ABN1V4Y7_9ACTN|nr:hypothetical protein [Streptomyces sp. NRRL F-5135]
MTSATFTSAHASSDASLSGADGGGSTSHSARRSGGPLRAVRVFLTTAFSVAVLGEYGEEAGIRRR